MIKKMQGDLLTVETDIICHVVNCQGAFNAGLAKQIRSKYPEVYDYYIEAINKNKLLDRQSSFLLGTNQLVKINSGWVCNMFAQDNYGTGKRYINYEAFYKCLEDVANNTSFKYKTIAFPKGIGCGLAGGNWTIIQTMIMEVFINRPVEAMIIDNGG